MDLDELDCPDEGNDFAEIIIENIVPSIGSGFFPAKTIVGRNFYVRADIYKDGHDVIQAELLYRRKSETEWRNVPMTPLVNDRWQGCFIPESNARYLYTLQAWVDPVATWLDHVEKKAARYPEIMGEVLEGLRFLEAVASQVSGEEKKRIELFSKSLEASRGVSDRVLRIVHSEELRKIFENHPQRDFPTRYGRNFELVADRKKAEFSTWYEMFPRSQGTGKNKSATFRDCIQRLPEIKRQGFDVLYLPPIHPIGKTNRKGPNNALRTDKNSPGSPWAIGSDRGGHKTVHPDLGTLKDFEEFVRCAGEYGIEIALDYAIQCSPDHPYVREHPDWFYRLPDGTIRHAENPPKKYQDIYPINFHGKHREELRKELKSILLFWIRKGVKIFRVDNPHTKPLSFWKWLIDEVQKDHPDVLFLSEAFTRPKVMKFLAKSGFSQSYTYFTWRNTKWELREYLEELTRSEMQYYFRPNFFANTPDILAEILQKGGRPAFKMRLVLAATLSSNYGIYSGYELCENKAKAAGSEEYLDSEKYEYKIRNWNQPGGIQDYIAKVNQIRRENPALQEYQNLRFFESRNEQVLCYGKWTGDLSSIVVVCVNLDPFHTQEDLMTLPVEKFGLEEWQTFQMKDLITGEQYSWKGKDHYLRLDPKIEPAHIFQLKKS